MVGVFLQKCWFGMSMVRRQTKLAFSPRGHEGVPFPSQARSEHSAFNAPLVRPFSGKSRTYKQQPTQQQRRYPVMFPLLFVSLCFA